VEIGGGGTEVEEGTKAGPSAGAAEPEARPEPEATGGGGGGKGKGCCCGGAWARPWPCILKDVG